MKEQSRSSRSSKPVSNVLEIDFTGVESRIFVPEGDYQVSVKAVEKKKGEDSGKPYLNWQLEVTDEEYEGGILYYTTTLQPQGLFNLKNMLDAMGVDTDGKIKLNLKELIGALLMVTVDEEVYQGRKRSRVVGVYSVEEESDEPEEQGEEETEEEKEEIEEEVEVEEEEPEEKPAARSPKSKKKK